MSKFKRKFCLTLFYGFITLGIVSIFSMVPLQSQVVMSTEPPVLNNFTDVVKAVRPAVVGVTATKTIELNDDDEKYVPELFELFRDRDEDSFKIGGAGSGFLISQDGYILTNNHVVDGADNLQVKMSDGKLYKAKLIGTDAEIDIALIKIKGKGFPYLTLGNSDDAQVGEWVMTMGNPISYEWSISVGVVSGLNRRMLGLGGSALDSFIQTDAAINFGNSGGPLVNMRGEVIGINTLIIRSSSSGAIEGMGFSAPINMAKDAIPQYKKNGRIIRGYIGALLKDSDDGIMIKEVFNGGPADVDGLKVNDIILTIDGKAVENSSSVIRTIHQCKPGKKITLEILRDKKAMTVKVKLTDRSEALGFNAG